MKKIALIAPSFLPVPAVKGGAIETLATFFIDQNEKQKHYQIDVYCAYDAEAERLHENYQFTRFITVEPYTVIDKFYNRIALVPRVLSKQSIICPDPYIRRVDKELSRHTYDALLIEGAPEMVLYFRRKYRNTILHIHTDIVHPGIGYYQTVVNNCDHFVTVSNFIKSRVQINDPSKTCRTVLNCVNEEQFFYSDHVNHELKTSLGFAEDDYVIVFAGRVDPTKGIDKLVDAVLQINNPKIKVLVIGAGWFSKRKKTDFEMELNRKVQGHERQLVFTGYIDHDKLPEYLRLADIAVLPSQCLDAAPLSPIEMNACGIPVITTNVGGIPEYSVDDVLLDMGSDYTNRLAHTIIDAYQSGKTMHKPTYHVRDRKDYYNDLSMAINEVIDE